MPKQKQDIKHLLHSCSKSQAIWQQLGLWYDQLGIEYSHNFTNIIYNTVHQERKHVINFITLIAKFNIYRSKCNNSEPTIYGIHSDIDLYQKIESTIAVKNKKYLIHCIKWRPIYSL